MADAEVHDSPEAALSPADHLAMGGAHLDAAAAHISDAHAHLAQHPDAAESFDGAGDGDGDVAPDDSARGMSRLTALSAQARAMPARGTLNHQTHAALRGRR